MFALCTCQAVSGTADMSPAQEVLERGYTLLTQAQQAGDEVTREQLLDHAVDLFKEAYLYSNRPIQVQALLGAAQSYLLMQAPRRVFPFLWQATPLQRAERSLQQALVLHPQDAGAMLLLGLVYGRQARRSGSPTARQRRDTYLARAAEFGMPLRHQTSLPVPLAIPPLDVEDQLLLLRYVDARGVGRADDVLLVYRLASVQTVCYGVVVIAGTSYPLVTDSVSGAMLHAPQPTLTLQAQRHQPPIITAQAQSNGQHMVTRFVWNGSGFMVLAEAKDKP